MKPILTLVTEEQLEELASRSNFRSGKQISEDGTINFSKRNSFNLIAEVKVNNSEKRTVQLISTPKGLRWKCSCTSRKDLFCKHCVAAAFAANKQ
ncbi:MAG: SWIM zinc finger family protein [Candidatus Saccharibacteria bacterium]